MCPVTLRQLQSPTDHLGVQQLDNISLMKWIGAHDTFFKSTQVPKLTPTTSNSNNTYLRQAKP